MNLIDKKVSFLAFAGSAFCSLALRVASVDNSHWYKYTPLVP